LIQNAEDNTYSRAGAKSEGPWLEFTLLPDRLVIDSNEDGFGEANIKAICAVGESTKTNIQGYIGEKGIGFKSVFKVAKKVHIQSGHFSFAFEYHLGHEEDGLGMTTPLNEDHLDMPADVGTRMILHLQEECDPSVLAEELQRLPDTLLLFLRKLKGLYICIDLPVQSKVTLYYWAVSAGAQSTIHKSLDGPNPESTAQRYWITKRSVSDMPHDHARRGIHEAQVVLAFPIDRNDTPVILDQHVYAFLPLRKVGYKVS
jgi:hypothetical protein